jgi:hypothetical protein
MSVKIQIGELTIEGPLPREEGRNALVIAGPKDKQGTKLVGSVVFDPDDTFQVALHRLRNLCTSLIQRRSGGELLK